MFDIDIWSKIRWF